MNLENLIRTYLESQPQIKNVEFDHNPKKIVGGMILPDKGKILIRITRHGFIGDTNSTIQTMNDMFDLRLGKSDTKFRVVVF